MSHSTESTRDLLERRALDAPDKPFCFFEDQTITFGALDAAVNRTANGLARAGIRGGDRVAVMLPNHPDHVYTVLALAKLGATHVPVNVHLKSTGLVYLLDHCGATAVVADARYQDELGSALTGCANVAHHIWRGGLPPDRSSNPAVMLESLTTQASTNAPQASPDPDHVVAIMYTSGTTGPPKGVMLSPTMYQTAGRTAGIVADVRPGDVMLLWEPMYHIAGVQALTLCLQQAVTCALIERFSVSRFWDQVRRYGASQIHYLGGVFSLLMKHPERPDDAANPARIAWGAAAPPDMWPAFERRFGVRVHECYGLTEGSSFTTMNLAGKVGSIGTPVDHFEVRIVDSDNRPLPANQRGEIVQRERVPGMLMRGYLNDPEGTKAALRDGWLHTGDLGYYDDEGFYYFVGRKKDSIRCRGENVSAWEVERVANQCPGVEESAAIGVPSALGEDEIKLFVVPSNGQQFDPALVIRWCEQRLAYFQVPRYVALVEQLPRTPSQRIRKDQLSRSVEGCWDRELVEPRRRNPPQ